MSYSRVKSPVVGWGGVGLGALGWDGVGWSGVGWGGLEWDEVGELPTLKTYGVNGLC